MARKKSVSSMSSDYNDDNLVESKAHQKKAQLHLLAKIDAQIDTKEEKELRDKIAIWRANLILNRSRKDKTTLADLKVKEEMAWSEFFLGVIKLVVRQEREALCEEALEIELGPNVPEEESVLLRERVEWIRTVLLPQQSGSGDFNESSCKSISTSGEQIRHRWENIFTRDRDEDKKTYTKQIEKKNKRKGKGVDSHPLKIDDDELINWIAHVIATEERKSRQDEFVESPRSGTLRSSSRHKDKSDYSAPHFSPLPLSLTDTIYNLNMKLLTARRRWVDMRPEDSNVQVKLDQERNIIKEKIKAIKRAAIDSVIQELIQKRKVFHAETVSQRQERINQYYESFKKVAPPQLPPKVDEPNKSPRPTSSNGSNPDQMRANAAAHNKTRKRMLKSEYELHLDLLSAAGFDRTGFGNFGNYSKNEETKIPSEILPNAVTKFENALVNDKFVVAIDYWAGVLPEGTLPQVTEYREMLAMFLQVRRQVVPWLPPAQWSTFIPPKTQSLLDIGKFQSFVAKYGATVSGHFRHAPKRYKYRVVKAVYQTKGTVTKKSTSSSSIGTDTSQDNFTKTVKSLIKSIEPFEADPGPPCLSPVDLSCHDSLDELFQTCSFMSGSLDTDSAVIEDNIIHPNSPSYHYPHQQHHSERNENQNSFTQSDINLPKYKPKIPNSVTSTTLEPLSNSDTYNAQHNPIQPTIYHHHNNLAPANIMPQLLPEAPFAHCFSTRPPLSMQQYTKDTAIHHRKAYTTSQTKKEKMHGHKNKSGGALATPLKIRIPIPLSSTSEQFGNQNGTSGNKKGKRSQSEKNRGRVKQFVCTRCPSSTFGKRHDLILHLFQVHFENSPPHQRSGGEHHTDMATGVETYAKLRYVCPQCGICLKMENLWKDHIALFHPEVEIFPFDAVPGTINIDDPTIQIHRCDACESEFSSELFLTQHRALGHSLVKCIDDAKNAVIPCPTCDKRFSLHTSMVCHLRVCKYKVFECPWCKSQFGQKAAVRNHCKLVHPDKPRVEEYKYPSSSTDAYKCELCPKSFTHLYLLRLHFLNCHDLHDYLKEKGLLNSNEKAIVEATVSTATTLSCTDSSPPISCTLCTITTDRPLHETHSIYEALMQRFCTTCNKLFSTAVAHHLHCVKLGHLLPHSSDTSSSSESNFSCDGDLTCSCGRCFTHEEFHNQHTFLTTHAADVATSSTHITKTDTALLSFPSTFPSGDGTGAVITLHSCGVCLKNFKTAAFLHAHIVYSHKKDAFRRLLCKVCNTTFRYSALLRSHERTSHFIDNSSSEKFGCPFCDLVAPSMKVAKRHILSKHPGKDFTKCDITTVLFAQDSKKGEINPFICDICSITFQSEACLKSHTKRQHFPPHASVFCETCGLQLSKERRAIQKHVNKNHSEVTTTGEIVKPRADRLRLVDIVRIIESTYSADSSRKSGPRGRKKERSSSDDRRRLKSDKRRRRRDKRSKRKEFDINKAGNGAEYLEVDTNHFTETLVLGNIEDNVSHEVVLPFTPNTPSSPATRSQKRKFDEFSGGSPLSSPSRRSIRLSPTKSNSPLHENNNVVNMDDPKVRKISSVSSIQEIPATTTPTPSARPRSSPVGTMKLRNSPRKTRTVSDTSAMIATDPIWQPVIQLVRCDQEVVVKTATIDSLIVQSTPPILPAEEEISQGDTNKEQVPIVESMETEVENVNQEQIEEDILMHDEPEVVHDGIVHDSVTNDDNALENVQDDVHQIVDTVLEDSTIDDNEPEHTTIVVNAQVETTIDTDAIVDEDEPEIADIVDHAMEDAIVTDNALEDAIIVDNAENAIVPEQSVMEDDKMQTVANNNNEEIEVIDLSDTEGEEEVTTVYKDLNNVDNNHPQPDQINQMSESDIEDDDWVECVDAQTQTVEEEFEIDPSYGSFEKVKLNAFGGIIYPDEIFID